jgi:hypothetical protein
VVVMMNNHTPKKNVNKMQNMEVSRKGDASGASFFRCYWPFRFGGLLDVDGVAV